MKQLVAVVQVLFQLNVSEATLTPLNALGMHWITVQAAKDLVLVKKVQEQGAENLFTRDTLIIFSSLPTISYFHSFSHSSFLFSVSMLCPRKKDSPDVREDASFMFLLLQLIQIIVTAKVQYVHIFIKALVDLKSR